MGNVGVTKSTYSEIHQTIPVAIQRGGGLDISNDDDIVLKVNLCDFRPPETGAVTHPIFLDAVLGYLRSLSQESNLFVVESDATVARPDKLIHWLGLYPILERYHASWVNLSKDRQVRKPIRGRHFVEVEVPETIANSDYLITMPKLKTHLLTKMTCCLKNQYGCLPYRRKVKFHPVLDDVIVDANLVMKPDFCIVDGILGMGGVKGPDLGTPIRSNVVITGKDPVSVDSVCAEVMGFNPSSVTHIKKAEQAGIGDMSFTVVGDDLEHIRTDFEFNRLYAWVLRYVRDLKDRSRCD